MDNSLISIIIPVYNVRPYLKEALDSCLAQTYRGLEIILIDDGSTDGSGQICDEYARQDLRFKVIHQANAGVSAARNAGLDVMMGRYVMFLDADDVYLPEAVSKLAGALVREQADIALCKFQRCYTKGRMEPLSDKTNPEVLPPIEAGVYDRIQSMRAIAERKRINHAVWNKIYRRELFDQYRFPEEHASEDLYATYTLFSRIERAVVIDDVLYLYRMRDGSLIHSISDARIRDKILSEAFREFFVEKNTPEIFLPGHLSIVRSQGLQHLMGVYCRSCRQKGTVGDEAKQDLRREIIRCGKKVDLSGFGTRFRIYYYLLRFCPKLLDVMLTKKDPGRRDKEKGNLS